MTTSDYVVDHKWSVGVPRLSSNIWVSKDVIFQGEHIDGDAGGADDHMVDHKWSVEVPRLGSYIWVSKGVVFTGEQFGGGADCDTGDHG